jgi:hypothetical protein
VAQGRHGLRFILSGQINAEHLAELRRLIDGEDRHRPRTLDPKRPTLEPMVKRLGIAPPTECECRAPAV